MRITKDLCGGFVLMAASCLQLVIPVAALATISIAMVPVGNAGNAADPNNPTSVPGGFGSVAYSYNIGECDVTAGQYAAFLNAVAATDPYGVYSWGMADGYAACGIARSGGPGSYTYSTTNDPNFPVNYTSWADAVRFSNWLTNNQPTGTEGNGTTETGSYTLNGAITDAALGAVARSATADYVIPTENEWYKAAYYNPSKETYYLYSTQSDSAPSNLLSATGTNNANYIVSFFTDPTSYLTAVGSFADSPSPYGTFDQGGDVIQWNESLTGDSSRGLRGGAFDNYEEYLQSNYSRSDSPTDVYYQIGFRVAQVPEPTSLAILALGGIAMLSRRRGVGR